MTETKYSTCQKSQQSHNVPWYLFISQPSLSNIGGTWFFVSDKLNFHVREDLWESTVDYECLWIDFQSNLKDDPKYEIIYRHPNSYLEAFSAFLNKLINKLNRGNKYCIIMGDFN